MGRHLSDAQIESVCREILVREPQVSIRRLRAVLRERYGSAGRNERLVAMWRRLHEPAGVRLAPGEEDRGRLLARVAAAEERTRLAEAREQQHQDRWASDVYQLREALALAKQQRSTDTFLHQRYHEALVKVAQLEQRVKELEARLRLV
jgi:hypothetical protein